MSSILDKTGVTHLIEKVKELISGTAKSDYGYLTETNLLTWAEAQTRSGSFGVQKTATTQGLPNNAADYYIGYLDLISSTAKRITLTNRVTGDTYVNSWYNSAWIGWKNLVKEDRVKAVEEEVQQIATKAAPAPKSDMTVLYASQWKGNTYEAVVTGILADETAQLIQVMPIASHQTAYIEAGIKATAQRKDHLTFTADTVPKTDIVVYVTSQLVTKGREIDYFTFKPRDGETRYCYAPRGSAWEHIALALYPDLFTINPDVASLIQVVKTSSLSGPPDFVYLGDTLVDKSDRVIPGAHYTGNLG